MKLFRKLIPYAAVLAAVHVVYFCKGTDLELLTCALAIFTTALIAAIQCKDLS